MLSTITRRAVCMAGVTIALTFVLLACTTAEAGEDPPVETSPYRPPDTYFDDVRAGAAYVEAVAVQRYVDLLTIRFAVAVHEDALADAAAAAVAEVSYEPEPAPSYSGGISGGGSGGCSGYDVPGYIIQAESGGNPDAVNSSSGAMGCAQVMPEHFNGGACSDLSTSHDGLRDCANRLWDGGAGSGNWSATR